MKNLSIISFCSILLLLLLLSCNTSETEKEPESFPKEEKYIIGFKETFLFEDWDEAETKYKNWDHFISKVSRKRISGDTLFLRTAREYNQCIEYKPTIKIKDDTIKLGVRSLGGDGCKSIEFMQLDFVIVIENPEKYIIEY